MSATQDWLAKLGARSSAVGSCLCLGLDPEPTALPDGFSRDIHGVEAFARVVLDAALPLAAAVKPNLAFYEAFGSAGVAALERLRATIPAEVPVLIDAKRGDIGSTAARQAVAIVDGLAADAVTLTPYVGRDAVDPFLATGTFVYIVCRTSNPAAGELQDLPIPANARDGWPAEPLFGRVARIASRWAPADRIGFVVGATAPAELAALRTLVPDRAFLVPGIGAQGGDLDATLRDGPARTGVAAALAGAGLLVNVGRGISGPALAGEPDDLAARMHGRAASWAAKIPVLSLAGA
jgi:orotidine 5'-phosphate decarboxylase subfamily 2